MIYHYCRVSSADQNLDRQLKALNAYKEADKVFTDKASGKDVERDAYQELKRTVRAGDEVIIKELDRLGRNKSDIKDELQWFKKHDVTVRVLDVPTTLFDFGDQTWIQDMVNNVLIEVLGSVAEQEREKIKRRQAEGIAAKRLRPDWSNYGRPKKEVDEKTLLESREKIKKGDMTVIECCKQLGISRATWYNQIKNIA